MENEILIVTNLSISIFNSFYLTQPPIMLSNCAQEENSLPKYCGFVVRLKDVPPIDEYTTY